MDQDALADQVQAAGGIYTPLSIPTRQIDLSNATIDASRIVLGRGTITGHPSFGIPNPGPVGNLSDWINGWVMSTGPASTVSIPTIAQGLPAIFAVMPVEFLGQRNALVLVFVQSNGNWIPFSSFVFAVQIGDGAVGEYPMLRPML